MQITPTALRAISKGFESRFQAAYQGTAPRLRTAVATDVPSSTRSNVYGWMMKSVKMRKWIGERVLQNLSAEDYEIVNEPYEATVGVDRDDIEDDNLGVYAPLIDELGQEAQQWADDLLVALIESGISAKAFDGQEFFDTDHPVDSLNASAGTYSNRFVGALTEASLWDVRKRMMTIKGADGRPLGLMPNLLVVPGALELTARKILEATIGANGATNVSAGAMNYIVEPKLTADDVWYLLDVSKPMRPFVFQTRKAPEFVSKDMPSDDNVFWQKQFVYGVDARGNAGYTLPFLAARVAGTDAGGTSLA